MESLVTAAADYLAFQGTQGCELCALFKHVHMSSPFAALPELPDAVKDFLWNAIIGDTDAFLLFCLEKHDGVTLSTACVLDDTSGDAQGQGAAGADGPDELDSQTVRKKKGGSGKVQSKAKKAKKEADSSTSQEVFLVAEKARSNLTAIEADTIGVRVGLNRALRLVALGIRAECLDRSTGSVPEYTLAALEKVGQAGPAGILRAELAQELQISNVNVHYYLKSLLALRHVAVTSVRYKNPTGQMVSNSAVLHLRKFAPDVSYSAQQASRERRDGGHVMPAEDEELLLIEITSKIASLPGQAAVVAELKAFFQFKGPPGHRLWRRVRDRLVKRGCIREMDGVVTRNDKSVALPMVQLVRQFTPEESSSSSFPWPEHPPYEMVLPKHISPTRALLEAMVARGGMSSEEIAALFSVNSKSSYKLMHRLTSTFRVEAAKEIGVENRRQRVYRYRLPASSSSYVSQFLPWQSQDHLLDHSDAPDPQPISDPLRPAQPQQQPAQTPDASPSGSNGQAAAVPHERAAPAPAPAAADPGQGLGVLDPEAPCCSRQAFPELYVEGSQPAAPHETIGAAAASAGAARELSQAELAKIAAGLTAILYAAAKRRGSGHQRVAAGRPENTISVAPTGSQTTADADAAVGDQGDAGAGAGDVHAADAQEPRAVELQRSQAAGGKSGSQSRADTLSYQRVRHIRETAILEHVRKVGFVLSGEPRLLWFNHSREAGLPLSVMEADHKTVKRLLDGMIARSLLRAPITLEVPVMKSRMALCRPRPVLVYCDGGPAAKSMGAHELHAAVKLQQAALDAGVRSQDYVNRAKILGHTATVTVGELPAGTPEECGNPISVATIGALVPAVRAQVDRALEPTKVDEIMHEMEQDTEAAAAAEQAAAATAQETGDMHDGNMQETVAPDAGAGMEGSTEVATGAAAPVGAPVRPFLVRSLDAEDPSAGAVAAEAAPGADAAAADAPNGTSEAGLQKSKKAAEQGAQKTRKRKRKASSASVPKPKKSVKILHVMADQTKFGKAVASLRTHCAIFVKAWRARALHYFLVELCGLQSGTPNPVVERGLRRRMPEVMRAACPNMSLHYIPSLSEYAAVSSEQPFDGSRIKLSPLLVLLCMPAGRVLLLLGTALPVSKERVADIEKDGRVLADLSDKELAAVFDGYVLGRLFEVLNHLAGMHLLITIDPEASTTTRRSVASSPPLSSDFARLKQQSVRAPQPGMMPLGAQLVSSFLTRSKASMPVTASMVFQVAAVGVIESPLTAQDPYRQALIQASSQHLQRALELRTQPHAAATAPARPSRNPASECAAGVSSTAPACVPRLVPVVPRHAAVPEERRLLPDTRLHVLNSIRRKPCDSFYQLEYSMVSWGGWLGFWDHTAAIRGDRALADASRERAPFLGARELLTHGSLFARKRLQEVVQKMLEEVRASSEAKGGSGSKGVRAPQPSQDLGAPHGSAARNQANKGDAAPEDPMAAVLAETAAGLASEQAQYREAEAKALKRRCAAMLGLSLAEFCVIESSDTITVSQVGRLGGLSGLRPTAHEKAAAKAAAKAAKEAARAHAREAREAAKAARVAAKAQKQAARKRQAHNLTSLVPRPENFHELAASLEQLPDYGPPEDFSGKRRAGDFGGDALFDSEHMDFGMADAGYDGHQLDHAPLVKRKRRTRRPRKTLREARTDGTMKVAEIFDSDDSAAEIDVILQLRALRKAEGSLAEETTLIPQGQKSTTRASRSSAGMVLLRAAGLISADAEAGDAAAQGDVHGDGEGDSSADEGDAATDNEGSEGMTRVRGRPIRWRADEEKALLRAFIQKTVTTGPVHELIMVPWPAFAGVHTHSCSACLRRINFYRTIGNLTMPQAEARGGGGDGKRTRRRSTQELETGNMFHQLTVKATRVHRLRCQQRTAQLQARLKEVKQQITPDPQPPATEQGQGGAGQLPDLQADCGPAEGFESLEQSTEQHEELEKSLSALVPATVKDMLPPQKLAAAICPEDLSKVQEGSLFVPRNEEEQLLHSELLEGLSQFFDLIPVTRPLCMSEKRYVEDVQLVCRPDTRRAAAADRRLRAELRVATAAAPAGQVASVAAADSISWRSSAAAAALLATIACTGPGTPAHTVPGSSLRAATPATHSEEAAALLCAHPQTRMTAAVRALCKARVLHAEPSAWLKLALTRQAHSAHDAVLQSCASPQEVTVGMRRLREDSGAVLLAPKERVLGGMVCLALTGVTSGHLDLSLEVSRAVHLSEASLRDLDQFAEKQAAAVKLAAASASAAFTLHSGALLSEPQPLNLSRLPSCSHEELFVPPVVSSCRTAATVAVQTCDVHAPCIAALTMSPLHPTTANVPGSSEQAQLCSQDIMQRLQNAARVVQGLLQSHLVAAGAVEQQFVPQELPVSSAAVAACMQCMRAIKSAVQSAGASGVRITNLLTNAALRRPLATPPSALELAAEEQRPAATTQDVDMHDAQEDDTAAEEPDAAELAQSAALIGGLLVVHDEKVAAAGAVAFDSSLWPTNMSMLSSTKRPRSTHAGSGGVGSEAAESGEAVEHGGAQAAAPAGCDAQAHTQTAGTNGRLAAACAARQHCTSGGKHALVFAGLQVALSMLHTQGSVMLQPHLGGSLSAVAAHTDLSDSDAHVVRKLPDVRTTPCDPQGHDTDHVRTPARCSEATGGDVNGGGDSEVPGSCQRGKVAAPWVLPSGGVSWSVLEGLIAQVHSLLCAQPGMPEHLLAGRLQHALGLAHLRLLLRRMCENRQLRCVSVPAHSTCLLAEPSAAHGDGMLVPTADGLVPGIFGGAAQGSGTLEGGQGQAPMLLPLVHHYFSDVASSAAGWLRVRDGVWV